MRRHLLTYTLASCALLAATPALATVVTDPQYLHEPLIMHSHFKKLADGTGWDPTPCRASEPR